MSGISYQTTNPSMKRKLFVDTSFLGYEILIRKMITITFIKAKTQERTKMEEKHISHKTSFTCSWEEQET